MSKPDYAQLLNALKPDFQFGNNLEVHEALVNMLVTDSTDATNSNFIVTSTGTDAQTINRPIVFNDSEALTNDNEVDPSKLLASKDWVKQTMKGLSYTTTGRVVFDHRIVLGETAAIVCSPNNEYIEAAELKQLQGINNNIQTQLNDRVNNWESNQQIWGTKQFNNVVTFQNATDRPQIITSSLVNDTDITTKADVNSLISGKQNTITDGSLTIARTSGLQSALDGKQATITNGSIGDILLTSTFVKPSTDFTSGSITLDTAKTLNGITSTILSYVDPTSSIQTQIDSKQATITDASLTIARTSGLQSALDAKQATIDSTHQINEDSVLNLATDLTARPTLIQLQDGTLELAISKLTVDNIIATSQTISFQEMSIANNEIPQVKITNLVTDLGAITTNITNLSNNVDTKAASSALTSGLAAKQDVITNGSIGDILLTSTFVKPSTDFTSGSITLDTAKTLNGINATTLSYVDPTSSIQTQIDSKQATITDASLTIARTSGLQSALDGKQATITNGSISDILLTSTFVKASTDFVSGSITLDTAKTLNGITSTTLSYLDATSSIQGQLDAKQATITDASLTIARTSGLQSALDGKQATLTTGSVSDSLLASIFVKASGNENVDGIKTFSSAPVLSGASITSSTIPTSAIASGALTITALTCTSETDSGNATFGSISEKFTSIGNNGTTNNYTLDYSTNTAVYVLTTAPTGNMTIRLNNCGTDTTKTITFAIIYNTTGKYYGNSITAYSDTSTQITLASSTPLYLGGTPSIATSTVLIQSFTLIRNFASNYVLTSVASYY